MIDNLSFIVGMIASFVLGILMGFTLGDYVRAKHTENGRKANK